MAGSRKAEEKVYIVGASGRLGRTILSKISAIPLVRRPLGLEGEIVTDFSASSLKGILSDASVLIHAAGSSDTLDSRKMHEANVELTGKIVSALPHDCRIIFASSISVYGKSPSRLPADEQTAVAPDSDYARSKAEAERMVMKCTDHVIFRIAPLYGPGYPDYFRVISLIERGKMSIIGDGANRVPFVHVEDAAGAFKKALRSGSGIYVLAGDTLTQKEIYSAAASELSVEPPKRRVPKAFAMLAAWLSEARFKLGMKRPSFTREHVAVLSSDRAFDCTRAKNELGFSPRPLEQGIREMVRAYRAEKGSAVSS